MAEDLLYRFSFNGPGPMNSIGTAASLDSLAIRSCRLFETTDLEEACDHISRVLQPHRLRLHGVPNQPRWHMDFLPLNRTGIGTIAFGPAALDVPPLDGYHAVIFCLSGGAVLRTPGEEIEINRSHGIICAPDQPLSGTFSSDCVQFIFRIDRDRLCAFTGCEKPRLAPRVDLGRAQLGPWLRAMQVLATDPETVSLVQQDAQVAADYEQLLLRLLLTGQAYGNHLRERRSIKPFAVRRAVAYMEAYAGEPTTLLDIAKAAGVPERTLNDAFRQFEGVSPMRYLRNLRLDRVRAVLLRRGQSDSITSIALEAGFNHLGRFAREYGERFGERPSETLKRC